MWIGRVRNQPREIEPVQRLRKTCKWLFITQSILKEGNYIWCFPSRLKFKVNEISIGTKSLFNTDWSLSRLYTGMRGGFRPHFRIGSSWYRIYCLASAKFPLLYLFNGHQSFNTWSPWYALCFSLNPELWFESSRWCGELVSWAASILSNQ